MLKLFSLSLKCTLILSALSLFSGSDISISLIVAQALAILALDFLSRNDETGTLIVDNIQKHIGMRKYGERAANLSMLVFTLAVGSVMFLVLPSFSSESIVIPDLTGIKPFSAEANYMSLEGYVASYCLAHGRSISRGEARKLVKEALKKGCAAVEVPCASVTKTNKSRRCPEVKTTCASVQPCACGHRHGQTVECAAKCAENSACAQPLTIERYDNMLKDYRSRSLATTSSRPGRVQYSRGRVAVLPFNDNSNNAEAADKVYKAVVDEFRHKGYSVVDTSRVTNLISNAQGISENDMARLSQCLEADMIVTGDINRYSRYKKVRLAGLLLGGIISGVHNYGDVDLSTKVFKASECAYIYENRIKERRKNQTFGMFYGTRSIMNYSLAKAVENLYKKF